MHVSFNLAADLDAVLKSAATTAGFEDAAAFAPEVRLVPLSGARKVYGFQQKIMGAL